MTKTKLPHADFIAHDGNGCPVDPNAYVEMIIQTAEGTGSSGVMRAMMHDWNWTNGVPDVGDVVGYREAQRGEEAILGRFDRFSPTTGNLKKPKR